MAMSVAAARRGLSIDPDRAVVITRAGLAPLYRHLYRVKVEGAQNIPDEGAAILAANHISFFDTVVLMLSVSRPTRFIGKAEYMDALDGGQWQRRCAGAEVQQGRQIPPPDRPFRQKQVLWFLQILSCSLYLFRVLLRMLHEFSSFKNIYVFECKFKPFTIFSFITKSVMPI